MVWTAILGMHACTAWYSFDGYVFVVLDESISKLGKVVMRWMFEHHEKQIHRMSELEL